MKFGIKAWPTFQKTLFFSYFLHFFKKKSMTNSLKSMGHKFKKMGKNRKKWVFLKSKPCFYSEL